MLGAAAQLGAAGTPLAGVPSKAHLAKSFPARPRTAHASRMWPLASRCVPRTGAPQGSARLSVAQFRARALGGPRRSQEVLGSPMQS